mgnify:CR=1 FL=1
MKRIALAACALALMACAPEPAVTIEAHPDTVFKHDTFPQHDSSVVTWTSRDVKECSISATDRGILSTRLEGSATIYWITRTITVTARCIAGGMDNDTVKDDVAITCPNCDYDSLNTASP